MILSPESLSANVARVRPLIGVRALVDEQIVGFRELAVAELADELLLGAGSAAGTTEETWIVLAWVERRHTISCSQPRTHKQWNSVIIERCVGARSLRLGVAFSSLLLRLLVGSSGVLGGLSGQLGLETLEHGGSFEHRLWVVLTGEELLVSSSKTSGRLRRSCWSFL